MNGPPELPPCERPNQLAQPGEALRERFEGRLRHCRVPGRWCEPMRQTHMSRENDDCRSVE